MAYSDLSPPRRYAATPADASLTGFASNVTGATWALTATNSGDSLAHQVSIRNDSANDKSSIAITLVGTDQNGAALTEVVTGPGASATVESAGYFLTLTSATPASTWGADTGDIGWVDEFALPWLNVNWGAEDILTLAADIGGTIDYTIQQTFDQYDQGITPRWITVAASQTADGVFQSIGGATGVRLLVNSYSSGATLILNANPTLVPNAPDGGSGATEDVNVTEWGGTAMTLGQKAMTASVPVVLASNQSSIPVAATVADGANVVEGAVADAAATAGGTGTLSAKLRRISTQLPAAVGQTTGAASLPVVPASDYFPAAYTYDRKTADGQVKAGAGTLYSLAVSPTDTVTAGVLTIYDSLTETGTVIFQVSLPIATFATIILPLNIAFTTGLFVGFDATLANVQVLCSYR